MDTTCGEAKEGNGYENGNYKAVVVSLKSSESEDQISEEGEEEESESQCLLPPRKGGMSRSTDKIKRSVQWNDIKGDNLAEVLVYEPSEVSDTDEDDSDSCICTIIKLFFVRTEEPNISEMTDFVLMTCDKKPPVHTRDVVSQIKAISNRQSQE